METQTRQELEIPRLRLEKISLVGSRLIVGREYPTTEGGLKCKYFGMAESSYDKPQSMPTTPVHRFIIGRMKNGEAIAIAQVDILKDNLQLDSDGIVIVNNETKYPIKVYLPESIIDQERRNPKFRAFPMLIKFARYNSFLQEESR